MHFWEGLIKLKDALSIPGALPESFVRIKIPAGTRIRMGIIADSAQNGTRGGAIQYQLVDAKADGNWIIQTRNLLE